MERVTRAWAPWGLLFLLGATVAAGCGSAMDGAAMDRGSPGDSDGPGPQPPGSDGGNSGGAPMACVTRADCPTAYTCEDGVCRPPESEDDRTSTHRPPVASPRYVYALNPSADSVARIDPQTLNIEAIPVGAEPTDLAVLPNEDAAVVLCGGDGTFWLIDSTALPSQVRRVPLGRRYTRFALSPDGAFLVAYADPAKPPPAGAEGIVVVVDLAKVRAGAPAAESVYERAAGFRVTDVLFRLDGDAATRAYVFAKSTLTLLDLTDPSQVLPTRLTLPEAMSADINSREITSTPDGHHIVLRSTVEPALAYFDGAALTEVTLPEVATDLDLAPDGSAAVAALRAAGQLAIVEIPADLLAPAGIALVDVTGVDVGQVVLPAEQPQTGAFALVFSNTTDDERFAHVALGTGEVTPYPLEKRVWEVGLSPDGKSAVVVHRAQPNSPATDAYDRAVDADEGYSVVDLASGYSQLKRTGTQVPTPFAFSGSGGYLGVALHDAAQRRYALDSVSLTTLVATTLPLASAPLFMGPVPSGGAQTSPHRIFVSQEHPAGRISVVSLDTQEIRTATGFTLNGEIR